MKHKFLELTKGQKILALIQLGLIALFLLLYLTVGRMQYINFRGEHLRFTTEGQTRIYSGQVDYKDVSITVAPDRSVSFQLDDTVYGPYIILEDPTAVPETELFSVNRDFLTGIEVQHKTSGEVLFRGGYLSAELDLNAFFLYDEDGQLVSTLSSNLSATTEPHPREIIKIALDPDPMTRGHVYGLLLGALFNLATVLMILYADELFRFDLRRRIENAEDAEPSDWELTSRWITWFVFTGCALVLYIIGLNNF